MGAFALVNRFDNLHDSGTHYRHGTGRIFKVNDIAAITVAPEQVTEEQVMHAGEVLGLKSMRMDRVVAHRVLGQHLRQVGVTNVGRGMYLFNVEQIRSMMDRIDGMIEDYAHEPAVMAKLIKSHSELAKQLNEAAKGLIDTGEVQADKKAPGIGLGAPPVVNIVSQGSLHIEGSNA